MVADVTIIIPVRDEEENIATVAREINVVLADVAFSWECVWVDDGSTDFTARELRKIHAEDSHHNFILLDRNFGQSAALSVGFEHASGEIIATLDGDGQSDPKDLPRLVELLQKHEAHMVNGVRVKRHDSFVRRISSRIANGFRNAVTGDNVTDVGCSVRVFRSECVRRIPVFRGMHRFLPTLVKMHGFSKVAEAPVNHRPRLHGKTKYGINNRLWVGLADLAAVKWMQKRLVFPEMRIVPFVNAEEQQ